MNTHWKFIGRHGDSDKHWWRLRYTAPENWRPTGITLSTHGGGYDESERSFNILNVSLRGHNLGLILPAIIMPGYRARAYSDSDGNVIAYSEIIRREFGFRIVEGGLHYFYGVQTHEWPGSKSGLWTFPWGDTKHIRHSLYDTDGNFFCTMPEGFVANWRTRERLENACPSSLFLFAEADGDLRTATCRIEEREWRRGRGIWRWLLAWRKHIVRRSVDIAYSGEVGARKGSWKGGTIGTSIDMQKDETITEAFRRHCRKENLRFIADVSHLREAEPCKGLKDKEIGKAISQLALLWPDMSATIKAIYGAGLTPLFDPAKACMKAMDTSTVHSITNAEIIPEIVDDETQISEMMTDGQIEGEWGSFQGMAIRQVTDEVFEAMVKAATEDGSINAAMHEEFEARGLDTAQINPTQEAIAKAAEAGKMDAQKLKDYWASQRPEPRPTDAEYANRARPHPEQEEMAERIRSVRETDGDKP